MNTAITGGLRSIIVPACDQRSFTRLCLRELYEHARPPWDLIVVDNGSTDGTGLYLEGVRDAAPVPVTVIANAENVLAAERGDADEEARIWRAVLAECPGDREAIAGLERLEPRRRR